MKGFTKTLAAVAAILMALAALAACGGGGGGGGASGGLTPGQEASHDAWGWGGSSYGNATIGDVALPLGTGGSGANGTGGSTGTSGAGSSGSTGGSSSSGSGGGTSATPSVTVTSGSGSTTYSEDIMNLNWSVMDFELWVNGVSIFHQTIGKGDQLSTSGIKAGDSVSAKGSFTTAEGVSYTLGGEVPSVGDGAKLTLYVNYYYTCLDEDGSPMAGEGFSGTYSAKGAKELPALPDKANGAPFEGWACPAKWSGVKAAIPAGTTGDLTLAATYGEAGGTVIFEGTGTPTKYMIFEYFKEAGLLAEGYSFDKDYYVGPSRGAPSGGVYYKKVDGAEYPPVRVEGYWGIGEDAFRDLPIPSVTIGDGVTSIGYNAFQNCTSLASVTIGDSVTIIGGSAFQNCTSLASVTIGDSVTGIGLYTFSQCTSLASVTIGDSVTSIDTFAFQDCTSLASVTFAGATPPSINSDAFIGCTALTEVLVPAGSEDAYKAKLPYILRSKVVGY